MQSDITGHVHWLRNTTPYINAHRGRTFVLVLSGEVLAHPNFATIIHDIALLNSLGVRLVLVYGSRPQIDEKVREKGGASRFHHHLRVTDESTLACIKEVLGTIQIKIQAQCSMGIAPSPLQNARLRLWTGNVVIAKPLGILDGVDMGYAGEVRRIDAAPIRDVLDQSGIVALPNLGYSPSGEVFNLQVEDVATRVAMALNADKLVFYGQEQGVRDQRGERVSELLTGPTATWLNESLQNQDPNVALPEQLRQIQAACEACGGGVQRSHLISYREDGSLLQEIFTRKGIGTMILRDSYERIRKATIEDVAGILSIITPLEEGGVLVRRSRERLEQEVAHFNVVELDGTVIGCAALFPFPEEDKAELACLAVHPEYQKHARGDRLLMSMEAQAAALNISRLFVLTTRSAHWFLERGFSRVSLDFLPDQKQALYNFKRNSVVLAKTIGS
jgi:amino-acid N-acetyltransferase